MADKEIIRPPSEQEFPQIKRAGFRFFQQVCSILNSFSWLTVITARELKGTADEITVTNGTGIAGDPVISLPERIAGLRKFGSASNNVEISAEGDVKLNGTATVWMDLLPAWREPGAGVAAPAYTAYNGTLRAREFIGTTAQVKEQALGFQMPHSYKEGSSITPHIHLFVPDDATGGTIKFFMDYTWTNKHTTGAVAVTTISGTLTRTASAGIANNAILSFGSVSGTGKEYSSILVCRIYRNPADAADTFGSSVWVKSEDIHVELDTIGTRTETAK